MFGGKSPFASKSQDKNEELANLVEATNTEAGITALGGLSVKPSQPSSSPKTPFSDISNEDNENNQPKIDPYLKQIFENDADEDYLILSGAEKVRPRSAYFTHTIGMAVGAGAWLGGSSAIVRNASKKWLTTATARTEGLTRVVRSSRNNAVRFGTFATLMTGTGIILESIYSNRLNADICQDLPTEEEVMEMQMKGIAYQPPELRPVPPEVSKNITTVGILLAGLGLAVPKSFDFWKKSQQATDLATAAKESGEVEKWLLNTFGRSGKKGSFLKEDPAALAKSLKYMAGGRIVGAVVFCLVVDYLWKSQHENANRVVKKYSSSVNRVF